MICKNCSSIVDESSNKCPYCGSIINNNDKNQQNKDSIDLSNVSTNKELLAGLSNNINNNQSKVNISSNKMLTIAIIFTIFFISSIVAFLPSNNNSTSASVSNSDIESNSNSTINSDSNLMNNTNITNDSNNISSNINNSGIDNDTIKFKGYLLYVPNTYTITSIADTLQLVGKNNKDIAVINVEKGNYDDIKTSPKALEDYVKNRQIVCNNIKTTYYNGVEFTTAEIISNGTKMVLGYSKINNNYVFEIVLANVSYTIDYSEFDTFADVVKTLKVA